MRLASQSPETGQGSSGGSLSLASDPLASAALAEAARDKFLYEFTFGQTVFDRFTDIPPPGGLRMLRKIVSNYQVGAGGGGGAS